MSTPRLARLITIASLLSAAVAAQPVASVDQLALRPLDPPAPHVLAYVDSSLGMAGTPLMDGGRTELELGDVNGDGHPDVVMVGDHGSPFVNTDQHGLTVWFGDGSGGWSPGQTGSFGYGGVALGDANGDGLMDVAYGVHHAWSSDDLGDQLIEVALGDGTGLAWTAWDDGLATAGETWGMFGTDFADLDADGDLDLASNSFGCCAGVYAYLNQGDGTWVSSFAVAGGNSNIDLCFADVDGDGNADIVTTNSAGLVWRGDGSGGFVAAHGNLPAQLPNGLAAGDVDGDGDDELVLVGAAGGLSLWSWGFGDVWTESSTGLPAAATFEAAELCDLDLDGQLDLAAFGSGRLAIYRGDGGETWLPVFALSTTAYSGNRAAFRTGTDLDHNGYPDICLVQQEQGTFFTSGNTARCYLEASTAGSLAVSLLAPGPGRRWRSGQVQFVDWTCAVPGTDIGTADVSLSLTGAAGPWLPLGADLPNNGRLQVTIPSGLSSSDCRLRVTVTTSSDQAVALSGVFVIGS